MTKKAPPAIYQREVGALIREHLFTTLNNELQEQADKALTALSELAKSDDGRRRAVFARFATVQAQSFLPIHLLVLDDKNPVPLGRRVRPLPRPRVHAPR